MWADAGRRADVTFVDERLRYPPSPDLNNFIKYLKSLGFVRLFFIICERDHKLTN